MHQVTLEATGLTIHLPAGQAYFNYYWLRDNCPSSFDRQTRERVFDICTLEDDPVAAEAWTDAGHLVLRWRGEDHESRFPLDWLQHWHEGNGRPDPAAVPRRHWHGGAVGDFARFTREAVHREPAARAAWAHALLESGVAIISGMENSDAALTGLANLLGEVRPSVAGSYFDVRVHIDPVNQAYTANALEMHTDTPAEETAPGIQFLHCRANSVAGGDSLFLDGAAVAEDFRHQDPEGFELLAGTSIPFYYEHDDFDWRSRQRVIELDAGGAVSGLTISQHMADIFDLAQRRLDRYYPAFVRFMRLLRAPRYLRRFRLNAGECIVFDNHRIIHGREAYHATSGERYLRGCYIDRGELRSSYRTLVRRGAAAG